MEIITYKQLSVEQKTRFLDIVNAVITQDAENTLNDLNIQENDLPVLGALLQSLESDSKLFNIKQGVKVSEDDYEIYYDRLSDLLYNVFERLSGSLKTLEYILAFVQTQIDNEIPIACCYYDFFVHGGVDIIPLLKQYIESISVAENPYGVCFCFDAWQTVIREKSDYHHDFVENVFHFLRKYELHDDDFNALILCHGLDFPELSTKYIDFIREIFTKDRLNITICGDLEDVEIALGLRSERETPKPKYGELQFLSSELGGLPTSFNTDASHVLFKNLAKEYQQEYEIQAKPQRVYQQAEIRTEPKIGRNEPCPCGSGKKYKKCCGA